MGLRTIVKRERDGCKDKGGCWFVCFLNEYVERLYEQDAKIKGGNGTANYSSFVGDTKEYNNPSKHVCVSVCEM